MSKTAETSQEVQVAKLRLTVLVGKSAGKEIVIAGPKYTIGRNEECDLRPKTDTVSRLHCELTVDETGAYVADLKSRNGTLLNGVKISDRCQLTTGDTLVVGKLEFKVTVEGGAASPPRRSLAEETTAVHASAEKTLVGAPVIPASSPKTAPSKPAAVPQQAAKSPASASVPPAKKVAPSAPTPANKDETAAIVPGAPDAEDFDIGGWLSEADADAMSDKQPSTRMFKLDELKQESVAAENTTDADKPPDEVEGDDKKDAKKKPGKLPKRPGQDSKDSRTAADSALKKFFNRR